MHHETIRLVSLNLRFRKRMAAVVSTQSIIECHFGRSEESLIIYEMILHIIDGESLLDPTGAFADTMQSDAKTHRTPKALRAKFEQAWSLS